MAFGWVMFVASLHFVKVSLHFRKMQGETGSTSTAFTTTQSGYLTLHGDLPHWPAISGLCCVCFWVSPFLWTYSALLRGRSPSRKIPFLEGGRRGLPTDRASSCSVGDVGIFRGLALVLQRPFGRRIEQIGDWLV